MKIAIVTRLAAKWDMNVDSCQCPKILSFVRQIQKMIRSTPDNGPTFEILLNPELTQATVDGRSEQLDISRSDERRFHLLYHNKSWNVEILGLDRSTKICHVKINNREIQVQLKDRMDDLLQSLGMASTGPVLQKEIKAPMPGMVINILVQEGQEVEKDTPLLILEAMKMENVIKSPTQGTIKRIGATKGSAVEKNALLLEFC